MRTLRALPLFLAAVAVGCGTGPTMPPMKTPDKAATAPATEKAPDKPATTQATEKRTIVIDNFTFDPPETTVPVGTEVTWVNHDDVPHTATSTAKPKAFDTGALDTDQKFSHVFTAAGEYEYFCAVHPHMTGRVIVK
jgi:plastocyanin